MNPPYISFLLPHALLPAWLGGVINLCLNILVMLLIISKYRGGIWAVVLGFTHPAFFEFIRMNNVDWIPLLGLLVPPSLGVIFFTIKPQLVSGAAVVLVRKHGVLILVPLSIVVALSLVVWGNWIVYLMRASATNPYNYSLFPFAIPVGIYLLYHAYKKQDVLLGALSTSFFTPYLSFSSITIPVLLLACKTKRERFYLWGALWVLFIIHIKQNSF